MRHPKAGIVDIVTGAMRCAGLWEAPADGWLLIFPVFPIFPIFLICGCSARVVTPRAHSLCWEKPRMLWDEHWKASQPRALLLRCSLRQRKDDPINVESGVYLQRGDLALWPLITLMGASCG